MRVRLSEQARSQFDYFVKNYKFRTVISEKQADGTLWLSRRDLQDFVTKIWSFGTAMEDLEMRETHCPFGCEHLMGLLNDAGLKLEEWLPFEEVAEDLTERGMELIDGLSWPREFLPVARN